MLGFLGVMAAIDVPCTSFAGVTWVLFPGHWDVCPGARRGAARGIRRKYLSLWDTRRGVRVAPVCLARPVRAVRGSDISAWEGRVRRILCIDDEVDRLQMHDVFSDERADGAGCAS